MRRGLALTLLTLIFLVIVLPAAVVGLLGEPPPAEGEAPGDADREGAGKVIRLYRADQERVVELELEEYLIGVVAAEMPASFEEEALKAQAVASRTYTLRHCRTNGGAGCDRSPEPADICSDSGHCQAWLDPENLAVDLGWPAAAAAELLERLTKAVQETAGEVVTYNGELIEAVYHSTCGGITETSHQLWGGAAQPYLQNVTCPYCGHSPSYRSETLITYPTLAASLPKEAAWPVTGGLPLEISARTSSGRAAEVKIGDFILKGPEFRTMFKLPSLACSFQAGEQGVRVDCRGKGHGVGLCQYGADGAAAQGKTYREILSFYYSGAAVTSIYP